MSQETTTPANKDVCVLSEEEIDAVSGAAMKFFWLAVYNGLWSAKCGSDPCLVYIKG